MLARLSVITATLIFAVGLTACEPPEEEFAEDELLEEEARDGQALEKDQPLDEEPVE